MGSTTASRAWRAVTRTGRGAPATTTYATALALANVAMRVVPSRVRARLLAASSTNVHNLLHRPLQVLLASALWLPGRPILAWVALLVVLMGAAERWWGTGRTLAVCGIGHVGATLLTQAAVGVGVAAGWVGTSALRMHDVGISYGIAALAGVLAHRLRGRRQVIYVAGAVAVIVGRLARSPDVSDVGHLLAFGLGLGLGCSSVWARRPRELRAA